jgi:hypothetical protein
LQNGKTRKRRIRPEKVAKQSKAGAGKLEQRQGLLMLVTAPKNTGNQQ